MCHPIPPPFHEDPQATLESSDDEMTAAHRAANEALNPRPEPSPQQPSTGGTAQGAPSGVPPPDADDIEMMEWNLLRVFELDIGHPRDNLQEQPPQQPARQVAVVSAMNIDPGQARVERRVVIDLPIDGHYAPLCRWPPTRPRPRPQTPGPNEEPVFPGPSRSSSTPELANPPETVPKGQSAKKRKRGSKRPPQLVKDPNRPQAQEEGTSCAKPSQMKYRSSKHKKPRLDYESTSSSESD